MEKKFYLPSIEITEAIHQWLNDKAAIEKRSMTNQLKWELEKLAEKQVKKNV